MTLRLDDIGLPTDGGVGHDHYLVPGGATRRAVGDIVLSGNPHLEAAEHVS